MYIRKVKRRCGIRSCKNTECFAVSRTREAGNTVIICKSCLQSALEAVENEHSTAEVTNTSDLGMPSLFFNAEAMGQSEVKDSLAAEVATASENPTAAEQTEPEEQLEEDTEDAVSDVSDEAFMCPVCGNAFKSKKGLQTHLRYCKSSVNKEL